MEGTTKFYTIDELLEIFSNSINYYSRSGKGYKHSGYRSGKATKIMYRLSPDEADILFHSEEVKKAIFNVTSPDVLRTIFKRVPDYLQEEMASNQKILNLLVSPRNSLSPKELKEQYPKNDLVFQPEEVKKIEDFIHSIKSDKVREELIKNKTFHRFIMLCFDKQLKPSFFSGLDVKELFFNIINESDVYKTRRFRKRNLLQIVNRASDHLLIPDDFYEVNVEDNFIWHKFNSGPYVSQKSVKVDGRALSLLSHHSIGAILSSKRADTEEVTSILKEEFLKKIYQNDYDFKKIFSDIKCDTWSSVDSLNKLYFDFIVDRWNEDEKLKASFLDFVYNNMSNDALVSEDEEKMLKEALYQKMDAKLISTSDYNALFYSPDFSKMVFYLKFGKTSQRMDYLHGISYKQLIHLNVRHINQIIKELNLDNVDELSSYYANAIKMYLVFGLERTLRILRGEYGRIDRYFFDNVSNLKVEEVPFIKEGNKYLPVINKDFIDFMFANSKNNHFLNMLDNHNSDLYRHWSYLYNNLKEINVKCHDNITLKKVNTILKQLSPTRDVSKVTPNNYKLDQRSIVDEICLGNKTRKSNAEVFNEVINIYEQMKRRKESSIPYVKGDCSNGYSYEMMRFNDPIAFTLGYKGYCCIRTLDIAHNHLLHATLCRNGRILLIYNQFHEVAAFAPLKRNGEVLIANSIECANGKKDEKAIAAFSDAVNDIVNTSKNNNSEKDPISLVCIGTTAYARPNGAQFPNDIKTPTIYEKNDAVYGYTDQYHRHLTIIYKDEDIDLHKIKYGDPEVKYKDPRLPIEYCDFEKSKDSCKDRALEIINAVRYSNLDPEEEENFVSCEGYGLAYCIFNEDWYIIITNDNKIYGEYLTYDDRAIKEYNIALEEAKKRANKPELEEVPRLELKKKTFYN